jgi:glyoxylase-like metal-dependent hydrolase (beta-lactamase superfamily II)
MIHHINCCSMRPPSERLINGFGSWIAKGRMVAHVLVIESSDGIVLVDSGIGLRDCQDPQRLGKLFVRVVSPVLDPAETAARQLEALGYNRSDVRHIVLTHLDVDHAGGLADFPDAKVHVCRAEYEAAMDPTWRERDRYRQCHWEHGPDWVLHDADGEDFMGLESVRAIVEPEVLLVPTAGHSRGHAAVAVREGSRWLLHCGDAYFHHDEMGDPPSCPGGLDMFQKVVAVDERARRRNQQRLRKIYRENNDEVHVFSAHDQAELERFFN